MKYKRYLRLSIFPYIAETNPDTGAQTNQNVKTNNSLFNNSYGIELNESTSIDFFVNSSPSGFGNTANIRISGLSASSIAYLTTIVTTFLGGDRSYGIQLDAGSYSQHGIIFTGTPIDVTCNLDTANYIVDIKANGNFDDNSHTININGKADLGTIISSYFETQGYKVKNKLNEKIINNLYLKDRTISQIATYISTNFRISFSYDIDNKTISLDEITEQPLNNDSGQRFVISETSNYMIGSPIPTISKKATVRFLLNPSISNDIYSGRVTINSSKFVEMNSIKYTLNTLKHVGSTRGNNWYSEAECAIPFSSAYIGG